jgi:putative nucleotidyltransferase with HDIG domain
MFGIFRTRLSQFFRRTASGRFAFAGAGAAHDPSGPPLPPKVEVVAPVKAVNRPALPPGTVEQLNTLILKTIESMPPLPQQAIRILKELNSDNSSARSVAELASQDPVLAASILRTANSAAYSTGAPIVGVQEGIAHLGFSAVRSLMLRLKLDGGSADAETATAQEELWTHGMAVSQIGEVLAVKYGADRQLCSTLGLLHDLGKLVTLRGPKDLRSKLGEPGPIGEGEIARERRVLGADHADIGAYVAGLWQLPPDIIEGIRFHHSPHLMPEDKFPVEFRKAVAVIYVANEVSKFLHAYSDDIEINQLAPEVCQMLGIEVDLESLVDARIRAAVTDTLILADATLNRPVDSTGRVIRLTTSARRDAAIEQAINSEADLRIEQTPTTASSLFFSAAAGVSGVFQFNGVTDTAGTLRQIDELLASLNAAEDLRARLKLTVRWLVASVRQLDADASVDVAVAAQDGHVVACVQCEAMKYDVRFGAHVNQRVAAKVLDREFAGVLNLAWFEHITCSDDGGALMLAA